MDTDMDTDIIKMPADIACIRRKYPDTDTKISIHVLVCYPQ